MAAVTVDTRTDHVFGDRRAIVGQIDIANDADTLVTGFSQVDFVAATSETNAAIGATISGGTVTFQTGGAEANVRILIIGL
jgi:hypothetical protein